MARRPTPLNNYHHHLVDPSPWPGGSAHILALCQGVVWRHQLMHQ